MGCSSSNATFGKKIFKNIFKEIEEFLISMKRETSLIGFQNYSQRNVFKEYDTNQFNKIQTKQLFSFLKDCFINENFYNKACQRPDLQL